MANNWAIVIGINQYRFLQPLNYAKRDAEAISDFLAQEAKFDRIFLFTDDSPPIGGKFTEPFRANLLRVLRQIFATPFMKDGDNFWFFFSGHGIPHNGQDYLMPLDGDPEDIENTGISTNTITNYLRSCGADNAVMILDACRSGGKKAGEGIGKQTEAEARQTGVISLFSCSPDQYSYELEAIGQGAFTSALLEGLGIRGRCATVERLNQYLEHRVPELVSQHLGRVRQIPYTIADPLNRSHLILMPQHASLTDIATLKNDAYRAERKQDWDLAQQLWIRVLAAASGQDMEAIEALQKLGIQRHTEAALPQSEQSQTSITTQSSELSPAPSPQSVNVGDQKTNLQLNIETPSAVIKDASSWLINLTEENFLAVYDIILDIRQELQLLDIVKIPLLPSIVKFQILMPVDSIPMRDRYCDLRWKSVNFLKKQGAITDYDLLREGHRWKSQLQIDLNPEAFHPFVEAMDAEYKSRFQKRILRKEINLEETHTLEKLESTSTVEVDDLSSERFGANYYAKLRGLLKEQDWKAADRETAYRMCEVMDRQEDGWLNREDIQYFPSQDLKVIDKLWVKYSYGKFGFSTQKKIYLEYGAKADGKYPGDGTWSRFADQIGWGIGLNKGNYFNSRWKGHLPTLPFWVDLWTGSWGLNKDLLILLLSRNDF